MATTTSIEMEWTAANLVKRFGSIPLRRICHDTPAGPATDLPGFAVPVHELFTEPVPV